MGVLRSWSQQDLAREVGRTQTAISYWESGKRTPGLDDLLDLADALEKDIGFFLPSEDRRERSRALLRSTAERLASSELEGALDELADQAEAADWPDEELTISEHRPVPAAAEVIETAGVRRPPVDVQVA